MNSFTSTDSSVFPFNSAAMASISVSIWLACPAAERACRKRLAWSATSCSLIEPRALSQTNGTRRARYDAAASVPATSWPATTVTVAAPKAFGTTCTTPSPGFEIVEPRPPDLDEAVDQRVRSADENRTRLAFRRSDSLLRYGSAGA